MKNNKGTYSPDSLILSMATILLLVANLECIKRLIGSTPSENSTIWLVGLIAGLIMLILTVRELILASKIEFK